MACDAAIIPAVLGSEVRAAGPGPDRAGWPPQAVDGAVPARPRLHLPGLLAATGAGVTPIMCVHWCDGGPTDLANMALLCPRHHTIVHQKGYTATVTTTEVTWHL